ncbi:MAG: flagellar M-ring protein FliF [Candidatus Margulisbacteria bacterium]|nr:flagellar M-ring protein FliF [Candidatus Margulisiibacteriota bacterium]
MGEQQKAGRTANRALAAIFGIILVAAGAVFFLIYKPSFPGLKFSGGENSAFAVLFKNLDYTEASNIVESLKTQGVKDYRLEDDGRTILVPRKRRSEIVLNVAREGIMPTNGAVGFEIFDKGSALGATDFDRQIKFSRAVGGELARSITRIYGIEEARVQVVIPQRQLFQAQQNPVLASVFVKVAEGELLSPMQIQGIISLVASSVEDLRRENITVVDYFGRVLSSEEYTKDYDRLAAILAMQKSEQGRKANTISVTDEVPIPGSKSSEGSIFEIYRQIDSGKRDKQEKSLMKGIRVKSDASEEDIYAAKMRFKERYEKLLERNIKQMADQFFPKNSAVIKVNVELNNQPLNTATPNSMIERITTMILLDQNNKDVVLTPEVREAFMKSIAASISYVKGRDRIDLRWAPKPNDYSKGNLFGGLFGGASGNATPSVNLSALRSSKAPPVYLYLAGALVSLFLLGWLLLRRRKKNIVAEDGFENRKSVFDEEEKEGFDDIAAPPVDKIKELAAQAPEKVAAVLEKWFQEDQENK